MSKIIKVLLLCVLLISLSAISVTAEGDEGEIDDVLTEIEGNMNTKVTDSGFSIFPEIKGFEEQPVSNYSWDPPGLVGSFNPLYIIGNLFLLGTAFIIRFSIMILDLGLYPDFLAGAIGGIVKAINGSLPGLMNFLLPVMIVVLAIVFVGDFRRGEYATMMKRVLVILLALACFAAFLGFSVEGIEMVAKASDEFTRAISGFIIENQNASATDAAPEVKIYQLIWNLFVLQPFEMGEIGAVNMGVKDQGEADALMENLQNELDVTVTINPGDRWGSLMTKYPAESDGREVFVDYLEDNYRSQKDAAFSAALRFLLGLIAFACSIFVAIFNLLFGFILLLLFVIFLGLLLSLIIIIPMALTPSKSPLLLKWWGTNIVGVLLFKVAIGIYITLTFLLMLIISNIPDLGTYGYLLVVVCFALVFVASVVLFFYLLNRARARGLFRDADVLEKTAQKTVDKGKSYGKRKMNERKKRKYDDETIKREQKAWERKQNTDRIEGRNDQDSETSLNREQNHSDRIETTYADNGIDRTGSGDEASGRDTDRIPAQYERNFRIQPPPRAQNTDRFEGNEDSPMDTLLGREGNESRAGGTSRARNTNNLEHIESRHSESVGAQNTDRFEGNEDSPMEALLGREGNENRVGETSRARNANNLGHNQNRSIETAEVQDTDKVDSSTQTPTKNEQIRQTVSGSQKKLNTDRIERLQPINQEKNDSDRLDHRVAQDEVAATSTRIENTTISNKIEATNQVQKREDVAGRPDVIRPKSNKSENQRETIRATQTKRQEKVQTKKDKNDKKKSKETPKLKRSSDDRIGE